MMSSNEDRNFFILEKLLEELSGKPTDIHKDLTALLRDPKANVAAERASHIKHLRYYLEDEKISELTRRAIKAKISLYTKHSIAQDFLSLVWFVLSKQTIVKMKIIES